MIIIIIITTHYYNGAAVPITSFSTRTCVIYMRFFFLIYL